MKRRKASGVKACMQGWRHLPEERQVPYRYRAFQTMCRWDQVLPNMEKSRRGETNKRREGMTQAAGKQVHADEPAAVQAGGQIKERRAEIGAEDLVKREGEGRSLA